MAVPANKPEISIIIPAFNAGDTLEKCINAVFTSDYKDYEIIVVDDGSTDNTACIAASLNCQVIKLTRNEGAAAARNFGARGARGEIVLFIDADVIIKRDSLSKIISTFTRDEGLSGVVGVYDLECYFSNFLSEYKHMVACYRERECKDANQDSFKACFLAIKKEMLDKYKFDDSFKKASIEDIEFGRRLISLGYKFVMDKSNEVGHVKKFTVKSFFWNQFNRSKDIAVVCLAGKARRFYYKTERENRYAKLYPLRMPVSMAMLFTLAFFYAARNNIVILPIALLSLAPLFAERGFLKFCFRQKGAIFTGKCILVYFYDGFISCMGALSGVIYRYIPKKPRCES